MKVVWVWASRRTRGTESLTPSGPPPTLAAWFGSSHHERRAACTTASFHWIRRCRQSGRISSGASESCDYAYESSVHAMTGSSASESSGDAISVRPRIMVVADGVEMRRLLWRTLTDARFEVAIVSANADLDAEAAGINPNLVVADVSSPIIDRFALIERARRSANVPVVLVGHDTGESIAAALRRGADECAHAVVPCRVGSSS